MDDFEEFIKENFYLSGGNISWNWIEGVEPKGSKAILNKIKRILFEEDLK